MCVDMQQEQNVILQLGPVL